MSTPKTAAFRCQREGNGNALAAPSMTFRRYSHRLFEISRLFHETSQWLTHSTTSRVHES